jgi:hypothetical protein
MAVDYSIDVSKDHENVTITYDLQVPVGGQELIAGFQVFVDGTNVIKDFTAGETRFNGTTFFKLSKPDQDANVSFSISSNLGWTASDDGILRGGKDIDDVEF